VAAKEKVNDSISRDNNELRGSEVRVRESGIVTK